MKNPNLRIGMTAVHALVEIARTNEGIDYLSFYIYTPQKKDPERSVNFSPRLLSHDPSKATKQAGRYHELLHPLCEGITVDHLNRLIGQLRENEVLGVLSEVAPRYASSTRYIPLMDFRCLKCPENLAQVEQFLRLIGQEGVILDSGMSYHYYGINLMNEKEWLDFLGDCLLSDLADARYIGHRLKDGYGILRISACPLRPKVPTIVSIL